MNELLEIALAAALVFLAGVPFVNAISKARKEMEEDVDED